MRLRLVLVRPEQPRNAGAVLRAAANFGAESVWIVAGAPWAPDQLREMLVASCGAGQIVGQPVFADSVGEAVGECTVVIGSTARSRDEAGVTIESPAAAFARLRAAKGLAALLLGPESTGLSAGDMALCHAIIRIPSAPEFPSLNVAQAAAVLLYEWGMGEVRAAEGQRQEPAPAVGRQEAVLALWSRLIAESGEWPASRLRRVEARARRLLHRASPRDPDLAMLALLARGLLRRLRD
ncbi:MAG: hypothetical protein N2111_11320 [Candidatus Sumerlaeaceae bacterium]|nr:hypothetical protein [Candidatus Sumerlaeaceae bacterium]